MPKGVYPHTHIKPKIYPADLVESVRSLYESGATQAEVSERLGIGRKTVRVLMKNHQIERRPATARSQSGSDNGNWKGDAATYHALHSRVYRTRGPANDRPCRECGGREHQRQWANLTGKYEDVNDYAPMCIPCHRAYDRARRDVSGDLTIPSDRRR